MSKFNVAEVAEGLEGIVATSTEISLVDGEKGRLVYRGEWVKDLAINYSFEEVCFLLWYGKLPDEVELNEFNRLMAEHRVLPEYIMTILQTLPDNMDIMSVLRTCISSMGDTKYSWPPTVEEAIEITSLTTTIIAYKHRLKSKKEIIQPSSSLGHVANYLYMLTGNIPEPVHVKALNSYFVLTMEHGMNASTFTSRIITSTESDMISAITGAIGAMKGPLHGGAPSEVMDMLGEIGTKDNIEPWIRKQLESGKKLMGFGHRVYKTQDPRAEALREVTKSLSGDDPWLELAYLVEQQAILLLSEYKPGRNLYTNVEFYAAAVLRAVNMPTQLFTPTFTASRIVGWTANVLEQSNNNRIYRPQSLYKGIIPNEGN